MKHILQSLRSTLLRTRHSTPTPASLAASSIRSASHSPDSLPRHYLKMEKPVNVLGQPLAECSRNPITGFYRDGYCNTSPADGGSHTVAAQVRHAFQVGCDTSLLTDSRFTCFAIQVNDQWLKFSASRGNDLRPILSDGCKWCLCVSRWKESLDAWRSGDLPKAAVPK